MSHWITVHELINDGETYVIGPLTEEQFNHVWETMDTDDYVLSNHEPMSFKDWQSCFERC